jgi:hypothetical protein
MIVPGKTENFPTRFLQHLESLCFLGFLCVVLHSLDMLLDLLEYQCFPW